MILPSKRFIAFILTAALLAAGLLFAGDNYGAYSVALGGIFGVYSTGQSWSDVREAQVSVNN